MARQYRAHLLSSGSTAALAVRSASIRGEYITHPARPLLLACGPGSGKTRILTHRIQWLIQREGLEAPEILALTFSRAAADELRGRLARALGPLAKGLWTGTFHGFGAWLLRRHAAPLGRTAAFTILDRDDTRRVIARLMAEFGVDGDLATRVEAVEQAKAQAMPPAGHSPVPRPGPLATLLAHPGPPEHTPPPAMRPAHFTSWASSPANTGCQRLAPVS